MRLRSTVRGAALAACVLLVAAGGMAGGTARAQSDAAEWPNRPVRIVMPNAPGSSIDTVGRIVSARLQELLGQSMVIENKAGASGAIGMEAVKVAPPDGYTLAVGSASSMSVAPLVQKKVPYDPLRDFAFVSLVAVMPNVLVVTPSLPVKNVRELIEYARANPGKVNMASAGIGAASHLAGVLLQSMANFEALHVPYKGGSPSAAAVVAGESQFSITPAPAVMGLVKGGRLRALGHSLGRRTPLLDMPSISETVAGYDYNGWAGLVAPRGTSRAVVDKLRFTLAKVVELPAVKEALGAQGAEATISTPEDFRTFLERDLANNARVVRSANIQPE